MHMDHMLDLLPFSSEVTRMALRERRPGWTRPVLWLPRGRGTEALATMSEGVGSDYARFSETFVVREYSLG